MPSEEKILQYLNKLKKEGLRPTLVCALVASGKVGLFSSNNYPGWEFIQGGMEFNELPVDTLEREVAEELGYHFHKNCHFPPNKFEWLFEDSLKTKVTGTVLTEDGALIKPNKKHYLVFVAELDAEKFPEINSDDFAFSGTTVKLHKCKWVSYEEASNLIKSINSSKKREIAKKALDKIRAKGFIK